MPPRIVSAVLIVALCWSKGGGSLFAFQTASIRTVALSSEPAAGTSGEFLEFSAPVINAMGQTAFWATVHIAPEGITHEGIWSEGGGPLRLVTRQGNNAPGTSLAFERFDPPAINAVGDTVFHTTLSGEPPASWLRNEAIYRSQPGELELIAATGQYAKGTDPLLNLKYYQLGNPRINDAGQVAFTGHMHQQPHQILYSGLSSGRPAELRLISQYNHHANGLPEGEFIRFISDDANGNELALNGSGQLAFTAFFHGQIGPSLGPYGIWHFDGVDEQLMARLDGAVPGADLFFRQMGSLAMNDRGQVVFYAVTAEISSGATDSGIWLFQDGRITHLVSEGVAPGVAGYNMVGADSPVINAVGDVALMGILHPIGAGNQKSSIWKLSQGVMQSIAIVGELAPETGQPFRRLESPSINALGQVAFMSNVGTNQALWATDLQGILRLIAISGHNMEVSPGDSRTIQLLDFEGASGLEDGRRSGFNELGQLTFRAIFTDGSSGIFVSNLVAVPEPKSIGLAAIMLAVTMACAASATTKTS